MTLKEIRLGIIDILRERMEIEYITGEDVTSMEQNPSVIHIQLIPLSSKTSAAGNWINKEILVDIAYMEKKPPTNEVLYDVLEKLDTCFKPYFKILNRAFCCDVQMDITDHVGHYKMIMRFIDVVPLETEEPLAETLAIEWRK